MTLEQLYALELSNDRIFTVLRRMVDFGSVPAGHNQYTLSDEEGTFYSRLQLHESLIKPSYEEVQSEFATYKQELIDAEQSRLAEVARVDSIVQRLSVILDPNIPLLRLGLLNSQPNYAMIYKGIVDQNDTQLLEQIESEWAAYQVELAAQTQVNIMDQLRANRDEALRASDFTQLADAPLTSEEKAQYRVYRNYLRSLPSIYLGGHQIEPIVLTFEQFTANPVSYPEGI